MALGCIIGWGCFVMPATNFLPKAGVAGSLLGLGIAAVFAMVICYNYYCLIKSFPGTSSTYQLIRRALGPDYAFFVIWSLLLAYMSVFWANSSAMAAMGRFFIGGSGAVHLYTFMGHDVCLSDLVIAVFMVIISFLVVRRGYKKVLKVMSVLAGVLLVSVAVLIVGMMMHTDAATLFYPAFSPSTGMKEGSQIMTVVVLAPWLFVGFETVTRAISETGLSIKRIFISAGTAIAFGAMVYAAMVIFSNCGIPETYRTWGDYMAAGGEKLAFDGLLTLYGVRRHMGDFGLVMYCLAYFSALTGCCIGYMAAASHTLRLMAKDRLAPESFARENKEGVPVNALILLAVVSFPVFFLGMNMISWAVDISTLAISVVYGCVSTGAFIHARNRWVVRLHALAGIIMTFGIFLLMLIPNLVTGESLARQDYMILALWSAVGLAYYRVVLSMDKEHKLGGSMAIWLFMFFLLFYSTNMWTKLQTRADLLKEPDKKGYTSILTTGFLIHIIVVIFALIIMFELFTIILNRQKQIHKQYVDAAERNEANNSLFSTMSHDIRTPLNAISAFTDLALENIGDSQKVEDYLNRIRLSGDHLLSLIDDVLEMNRIESGKVELSKEPVNLRDLVARLQNVLKSRAKAKEQRIIVAFPDIDNENIICDRRFLSQALLFLMSNAIKYTPDGGIIELGIFQLTASENERATYMFSIRDNGVGYTHEIEERVLGALVSDNEAGSMEPGGENLEMNITRKLIELMDGHIEIEFRPDTGSEVFVTLEFPVTDKIPDGDKSESGVDYTGRRALVVDDIQINRQIVCAMLDVYGFETEEAQDGDEAVALLSSVLPGHYDLVLMDLEMPKLNGDEAAKRIRGLNDPVNAAVPIIALTANVFEEDRKRTMEAGMNGFLSKPVDRQNMMEMISQILAPRI